MTKTKSEKLVLKDGSSIAVIGGGPAGSFYTYFAFDLAQRMGLEINIDIIEPKDFTCAGPKGCNNCGGIVSESLVQTLSTEGIVLPSEVIRRGIESYTMHLEQGTTVIDTPDHERRIASMFRGCGPIGSNDKEQQSFDNYLLRLCQEKGANLINDRLIEAHKVDDGVVVKTKNGLEKKYDLIVGSVGLNKKAFEIFKGLSPAFIPPKQTKTYICEYKLDRETIDQHFGDSMHVFLLNVPNIKFGALIPKGHYVTLVLLGSAINKEIVSKFVNSDKVRSCFPEGMKLEEINPCQCFPSINVKPAKNAYADRMVLIGDSSSSKLYKNGIGAAYITAKAAARTSIFEGISNSDFKKSYQAVCSDLDRDNLVGKLIFLVTTVIQKSGILKAGLFRMVVGEQKKPNEKRPMSSVLWDTFTGSASYRGILKRVMNPLVLLSLISNVIIGIFKPIKK